MRTLRRRGRISDPASAFSPREVLNFRRERGPAFRAAESGTPGSVTAGDVYPKSQTFLEGRPAAPVFFNIAQLYFAGGAEEYGPEAEFFVFSAVSG